MKSRYSIFLIVFLANCITYIPRLPFTKEARDNNLSFWYYRDYSDWEKREDNISFFGKKYLDFVERKHDTKLIWMKLQIASLDQVVLQNALRALFYKKKGIGQIRLKRGKYDPTFSVGANTYDSFQKVEIRKVPHYFLLITISEGLTIYNEIFVIKKEGKYLEIFKSPLLKKIEGENKIGMYTSKTSYGNLLDSEMEEYVLDSFSNLEKLIEKRKIEFEKLEIKQNEKGFSLILFGKNGPSVEYQLYLNEE